jgi:hypothetical protein
MKLTLNILGVILILLGTVWFFQGINVLPGSFMTGQMQWAIYGALAVVIGVRMLIAAWRMGGPLKE